MFLNRKELNTILSPSKIKNKLATRYIGQTICYFPQLSSTNNIAKQKVQKGKSRTPEGTLIIAEKQLGGKGRSGKVWLSPVGGIWLSIVLYPKTVSTHVPLITIMTAVAVARTLNKLFPIKVQIKWPNDILIEKRKVCGILTETGTEEKNLKWVIVGIGINADNNSTELPEEIRNSSISLKEITGQPIPRIKLIQYLCSEFEMFYDLWQKKAFSAIIEEWKLYSYTLGEKVRVDIGNRIISGEAIDITDRGALVLKRDDGQIEEIISGTVLK